MLMLEKELDFHYSSATVGIGIFEVKVGAYYVEGKAEAILCGYRGYRGRFG